MPSAFSDKERAILVNIRVAETNLLSAQSSLDDWNRRVTEVQNKLNEYLEYRNGYSDKVKILSETMFQLREDLRELFIAADESVPIQLTKSIVEDCVDQLESRSKVEASNARSKVKCGTGKGRSNERRSG